MSDTGFLEKTPVIAGSGTYPDSSKEQIGKLVSVFRLISKDTVTAVSARGISSNNQMETAHPKLEKIFSEAAKAQGSTIDRTRCVFAFPADPRKEDVGLTYRPAEDAVIKIDIDPKGVMVADGATYTLANQSLEQYHDADRGVEAAREHADAYYANAIPLEQYLALNKTEKSFFSFPEVIIQDDILPYRITVLDPLKRKP